MVKEHHVAWADRIGLNKQWARDIQACGEAFGTVYYMEVVRRFRNDIPNIKGGPQLKTTINDYEKEDLGKQKDGLMSDWKRNYPQEAGNESYVLQKQDEINQWAAEELYKFMIQLLEDNGFCFYESNVEEDEMR